jgi:hypothetical protein
MGTLKKPISAESVRMFQMKLGKVRLGAKERSRHVTSKKILCLIINIAPGTQWPQVCLSDH